METYTLMRAFADSWMLLGLMLFFVGMVVWVFRPAAKPLQQDAARMIFRHDTKPAPTSDKEA
ncbi:MAG: cbb3-type cytochrome c oxidase subunit 3 [Paracoccaceae bacterium]